MASGNPYKHIFEEWSFDGKNFAEALSGLLDEKECDCDCLRRFLSEYQTTKGIMNRSESYFRWGNIPKNGDVLAAAAALINELRNISAERIHTALAALRAKWEVEELLQRALELVEDNLAGLPSPAQKERQRQTTRPALRGAAECGTAVPTCFIAGGWFRR